MDLIHGIWVAVAICSADSRSNTTFQIAGLRSTEENEECTWEKEMRSEDDRREKI